MCCQNMIKVDIQNQMENREKNIIKECKILVIEIWKESEWPRGRLVESCCWEEQLLLRDKSLLEVHVWAP